MSKSHDNIPFILPGGAVGPGPGGQASPGEAGSTQAHSVNLNKYVANNQCTETRPVHTDKKEKQIVLISKEIQNEAVAKSIWLKASSYMGKYLRISSYIRKPYHINDFATASLCISLYIRNIWFSFLSVYLQPVILIILK